MRSMLRSSSGGVSPPRQKDIMLSPFVPHELDIVTGNVIYLIIISLRSYLFFYNVFYLINY